MIILDIMLYTVLFSFFCTLIYPMIRFYNQRPHHLSIKKIIFRILKDISLTILIVILPVSVFWLSSLLTPWSQEESTLGYWDMFMQTKYFLSPFVLWAASALYAVEVLKVKNYDQYWIMLGLASGLMTSLTIIIYAFVLLIADGQWHLLSMFVFIFTYVPLWYFIRFAYLVKSSQLKPIAYLYAFFSQLPFWFYSIHCAKQEYLSLPEFRSDCFVATASAYGYQGIIGETIKFTRGNRDLRVSKQMITFWAFEDLWKQTSPKTHYYFRLVYNVIGKKCSSYIRTPILASVFFILLKPFEWVALVVIHICKKTNTPTKH